MERVIFFFSILAVAGPVSSFGQTQPSTLLKEQSLRWAHALSAPTDSIPFALWDHLFDWEETARRGLRHSWVNLSATWKVRMVEAIRVRVATDGTTFLRELATSTKASDLQWQSEKIEDDKARVYCNFIRSSESIPLTFRMLRADMSWQLFDVRSPDFRLRDFIQQFDQLIGEGFSMEYVESVILRDSIVHIDHFALSSQGVPPKGWGWRKRDADKMSTHPSYFVNDVRGNGELAANGASFPLVRPISYNINEYPVLSWKWGLDSVGRNVKASSVAAKMTVLFYQNWIGIPVTISYIWSRNLPACTTLQNPGWFFDDHEIVLQRDFDEHRWHEENVNIVDDYIRIFGEPPPNQCTGISIIVFQPYHFHVDDIVAKVSTAALSCGK